MAKNFLIVKKAKDWRKAYSTIEAEQENRLSAQERQTMEDIKSWIAEAGYTNAGEAKVEDLVTLTQFLNKENQDRMQDDYKSAVNTFVSVLEGLVDTYKRNENVWIDFYEEVKNVVGEPRSKGDTLDLTPDEVEENRRLSEMFEEELEKEKKPERVAPRPIQPRPVQPKTTPRAKPVRKKGHFSWAALIGLAVTYGGLLLLGALPMLIGKLSAYLFDTGHWFFGILVAIGAVVSIGIAWYGWLAAAALLVPIWICTTSWWLLGVLVLLFEAWLVYEAACVDTK